MSPRDADPAWGGTYFVEELTLAVSGAAVIVAATHGLRSLALAGIGADDMGDWVPIKLSGSASTPA